MCNALETTSNHDEYPDMSSGVLYSSLLPASARGENGSYYIHEAKNGEYEDEEEGEKSCHQVNINVDEQGRRYDEDEGGGVEQAQHLAEDVLDQDEHQSLERCHVYADDQHPEEEEDERVYDEGQIPEGHCVYEEPQPLEGGMVYNEGHALDDEPGVCEDGQLLDACDGEEGNYPEGGVGEGHPGDGIDDEQPLEMQCEEYAIDGNGVHHVTREDIEGGGGQYGDECLQQDTGEDTGIYNKERQNSGMIFLLIS